MWLMEFFKTIFGAIFGNKDDRFSETRNESRLYSGLGKDINKKRRYEYDEAVTAGRLKKLFKKLPKLFDPSSRASVKEKLREFNSLLDKIDKGSIKKDWEHLRTLEIEWGQFKAQLRDGRFTRIISEIDAKILRLKQDEVSEARVDDDERKVLARMTADNDAEERAA